MWRKILASVFTATLGISALSAQNETVLDKVNPLSSDQGGGLRLGSASVFMNYDSVAPEGLFGSSRGNTLVNDVGVGGSATIAYSKFGDRSDLSISYSPSYVSRLRYSSSDSLSQSLSLNWRRHLTPKWSYNFAGSAASSSVSDAVFLPTTLTSAAAVPSTFNDLASGIVSGQSTNNQLTAILTGAPILASPTQLVLYGDRILVVSLQSGLAYSYSSRLTFRINVSANRLQNLNDPATTAGQSYLISHTTAGTVGVGIGYSLSPRTQVSVDLSSSRAFSSVQDAYATSANVSLGHIMGMNWFTQVHGGTGFITALRESYALPAGAQFQLGGGIGYKTHEHTFLASVERSAGDAYAFGAGYSLTATGAWNWSRPGSAWSATSSFGQQRLVGSGFGAIDSWRASAGIARMLGAHMSLTTQYEYLSDTRVVRTANGVGAQHMARISLAWTPQRAFR